MIKQKKGKKAQHENRKGKNPLNKSTPLGKKAQHEIMGFVLIIIIVSIVGLIFLGFLVGRGEPIKQESVQVSNLLASSMYYTSDCAVNYVPNYKSGQDLIKSCWSTDFCLDERSACSALNSTMKEIIGESLDVSPDKPNKAYELNIYYKSLDEAVADQSILILEEGDYKNCSSQIGGSHSIHIAGITPGIINVELDVCRG